MAEETVQMGESENVPEERRTFVVGVGASAGGLEVLQQFFSAMPRVNGCAFVVVQHLSPDHKSMLAEILSKQTKMPVLQARNEMRVLPNHVYLITPRNNMVMRDGRLYLSEYDTSSVNHPIDIFFTSLAEDVGERGVAVVLSGTGSDGTRGIKAVKESGGLVIVQDPNTAKFDGMPRSAINTGLADFILPPREVVEEILNFAQHPSMLSPRQDMDLYDDDAMLRIYDTLNRVCGIDYTHYKRSTVIRRIERRMVVTHCSSLSEFATMLELDEREAKTLGREILIGVTQFFRDEDAFQKLKYKAIYDIISRTDEDGVIRVWVAGCSTGEEAYSLAMLFRETMDEQNVRRTVKIFATDVDAQSVDFASKGVYSDSIVEDVSPERLLRFFEIKGDSYHVSKEIRKMIVFAPHNVFTDPPFGKLDLISCRNVMIYFQSVLQKTLFSIFHSALKDGGYLFLGKSETANDFANVFVPVCNVERIYMHVGEGKMPDDLTTSYKVQLPVSPTTVSVTSVQSSVDDEAQSERLYTACLERFLPPSVVINESNRAIHFFGDYDPFLSISPGKASFNIFNLVHDDLSLAASTAISRCRSEEAAVTYTDISVRTDAGVRVVDMTVQPLWEIDPALDGMIALVFADHNSGTPSEGALERYDIEKTAARRIAYLENELQSTQNDLKASISDLETVNEELQAANEELLTTNEELQAANEELYTVNAEYEQKLDELTDTTNDLNNFLSSTMIGILFLDNALNIRKFTEYVGREFGILEHDVGRSIQIVAHTFSDVDIVADAEAVLKDLMPIDKEVTTVDGKNYTLRIAPYRTTENSIEGLVVTIIDNV